ncbi:MAG: DUF58 domain-containing protein [Clostridia bacterium]|nr:DUF58 domain-containing protein [Clostridia bacterium]
MDPSIKALLAIIGVVIFALIILLYRNLKAKCIRRIEYSRHFTDEGVHEGMNTVLVETIYNPSLFFLFSIHVESYLYSGIRPENIVYDNSLDMHYCVSTFRIIPPFGKIQRRNTICCEKRGLYELESVEINYRKNPHTIKSEASIYVYPKPVSLSDVLMHPNSVQGDNPTNRRLIHDPFSFSGIRDYAMGDSMRMINYKATARSVVGSDYGIKVNKFDYVSNRNVLVLIDYKYSDEAQISGEEYNAIMENALRAATSLICEASEAGYRVGLAVNCKQQSGDMFLRFPSDSGVLHYIEMLKSMATLRANAGMAMHRLIEMYIADSLSETEVVLFANEVDETSMVNLERLSIMGNSVNTITLDETFINIDDNYMAG